MLAKPGLTLAGWTVAIGPDTYGLPGASHRDPADRLIVATARALACPLPTADRGILD